MNSSTYQLIARRADRPESLLFRDRRGRHFLRASCGSRLVRIMAHDAARLQKQYPYLGVLDSAWRSEPEAVGLECFLPQEHVSHEMLQGE